VVITTTTEMMIAMTITLATWQTLTARTANAYVTMGSRSLMMINALLKHPLPPPFRPLKGTKMHLVRATSRVLAPSATLGATMETANASEASLIPLEAT